MASKSEEQEDKCLETKCNLVSLVYNLIKKSVDKSKCNEIIFKFKDGMDIGFTEDPLLGLKINHIARSINYYSRLSETLAYFVADKYSLDYASERTEVYSCLDHCNIKKSQKIIENIIKARREFLDYTYSREFREIWDEQNKLTKKIKGLVEGKQNKSE